MIDLIRCCHFGSRYRVIISGLMFGFANDTRSIFFLFTPAFGDKIL